LCITMNKNGKSSLVATGTWPQWQGSEMRGDSQTCSLAPSANPVPAPLKKIISIERLPSKCEALSSNTNTTEGGKTHLISTPSTTAIKK
jgi:hypothetical protein